MYSKIIKKLMLMMVVAIYFVMVFAVPAIGQGEGSSKSYLIAVLPKLVGGVWFNECLSAGKWFIESRGHRMIVQNPSWSSKKQVDIMKTWAGDPEIDGVLLQAVGGEEVRSGIKALTEAGKPIMIYDAEAGYAPEVLLSYAIDWHEFGAHQAELTVKLLRERYGTARGVVIYSVGNARDANHISQAEGYRDVFAKYPHITTYEVKAMMDEAKSATRCAAKLRSLPKVDALCPQGIEETIGFILALQREDMAYKIGHPKHIIMVCTNTGGPIMNFIKEGFSKYAMEVPVTTYVPLAAYYMIEYLDKGKDVLPKIGDTIGPENTDITVKVPCKELDITIPAFDWGPTQVIDMREKFGHPMIRVKTLDLDRETIGKVLMWSNLTKKLEEVHFKYPTL